MNLTRRQLLGLLLVRPGQSESLQVSVLEVFGIEDKARAILVNRASDSSRDRFAQWLQNNPRADIRIRNAAGEEADATIFRVRMCFGRGLILPYQPISIRERDVLSILAGVAGRGRAQ